MEITVEKSIEDRMPVSQCDHPHVFSRFRHMDVVANPAVILPFGVDGVFDGRENPLTVLDKIWVLFQRDLFEVASVSFWFPYIMHN